MSSCGVPSRRSPIGGCAVAGGGCWAALCAMARSLSAHV